MEKGRLEAFSDGVIAIIITIMVLELRAPHGHAFSDLRPLAPVFASYALSYVYLGIYWNNHHHMLQAAERVNGAILWANLHLLFWLSLIPFGTAWIGEAGLQTMPTALYGLVLLMSAIAYQVLARLLARHHGRGSSMDRALGKDCKGWASLGLYAAALPLAFFVPKLSYALYMLVAAVWFVPDRRFEDLLGRA